MARKQKGLNLTIVYYNKGKDTIAIKSITNWDGWSICEVKKDKYGSEIIFLDVLTRVMNASNNMIKVNFKVIEVPEEITYKDIVMGVVE